MAATWTVSTMERTLTDGDLSDVVTSLHWRVTDSETVGEGDDAIIHSGRCYGTVGLEAPDADNFTAYADILEADAIAWAKAALGEEQVTAYEASVASQIELSKNPVSGTGVPW
tara:strand:- start:355 stop:693 length:339 start_codon:yes stop_codon:yes gene_type:complete